MVVHNSTFTVPRADSEASHEGVVSQTNLQFHQCLVPYRNGYALMPNLESKFTNSCIGMQPLKCAALCTLQQSYTLISCVNT